MKTKNLKTMYLRKRLIANMEANQLEALKGGTRPGSNKFDSVDLTICPGQMVCEFNISE
ncbi:hypothetical protein [Kordia sp.]|uniref:hypothetical protein n=1 Tax=Kordia sp. TaxID=1965332 RepID=UPI003D288A71